MSVYLYHEYLPMVKQGGPCGVCGQDVTAPVHSNRSVEGYPPEWVKLVLAVNRQTGEFHAIGGLNVAAEGDESRFPGMEALQKRFALHRQAVLACDRYFRACAKAWAEVDGRVINKKGVPIVAADGLDALCDEAARMVARAVDG